MKAIRGTIYDHPKYYDVLFGADWKAEFDFLKACFGKHAGRTVRRLFEPACGTGRLLIRFAQAGFEVSGNDLNAKAVGYCNRRLLRHGFAPTAAVGDMAQFHLPHAVDAAFSTINSFRHLGSDRKATSHLQCVAKSLAEGGIYILGMHLTPTGAGPACNRESWFARRGNLEIVSHMWSMELNRRRRQERFGFQFDIRTPTRQFRLDDELVFRTYTAGQLGSLLGRVPELEVVATYDFAYRIEQPIRVGAETEDVVFVLRKR